MLSFILLRCPRGLWYFPAKEVCVKAPCVRITDVTYAKVIRAASEPVLKTVGTVMSRMGIDTSLWRLLLMKILVTLNSDRHVEVLKYTPLKAID